MGLFSRKKRTDLPPAPPAPASEQHEVITHLKLSDEQFGTPEEREALFALEERIVEATAAIGCNHDGNEFGGGEVALFTYGPDADALFAVIENALLDFPVRPGSYAIKRYGDVRNPGAREQRIELA